MSYPAHAHDTKDWNKDELLLWQSVMENKREILAISRFTVQRSGRRSMSTPPRGGSPPLSHCHPACSILKYVHSVFCVCIKLSAADLNGNIL